MDDRRKGERQKRKIKDKKKIMRETFVVSDII
jgi:hypothetical protein